MSWRPATKFLLLVGLNIALLLVLSISPAKATEAAAMRNVYYLPVVRVEWTPPCGGVPILISPPDGSVLTEPFKVVFDGGYRAGTNDWLELEMSSNPDFDDSIKQLFQPAGKRWEVDYAISYYGMIWWYWRASVWCNGPDRTFPPDGYIQSPYSQVWSFKINFYPYPPP